ncbi:MAG: cytidylate kinase [Alphaproteobacteria bacterium]|jgi:cytidylate kinase|nr:cytidylate kinase [Alphaproteobacteria bacterium]
MIIALDGPSAAGKGTLARRLAAHYRLALLDTGLIYRAVGARVLADRGEGGETDRAIEAARKLQPQDLEQPGLREEAVGAMASKVAAIPEVRLHLIDFQRRFAKTPPGHAAGSILDGRDIGTVICPDADVKIFLTASAEARAERRFQELQAAGATTIKARVLADMHERDVRDSARSAAPLVPAADAFQLDTTTLSADQVFDRVVAHIDGRISRRGS